MPGFDGTGPIGYGSRTGGGFGFCPPGTDPSLSRGIYGVGRGGYPRGGGRGRAWGGGRGWGWRSYPSAAVPASYPPYPPASGTPYGPVPGDEAAFLREQAKGLQTELDAVSKRIEELEGQKPNEQD